MDLLNYKTNCRLCLKSPIGAMKDIFTHKIDGYEEPLAENIFTLLRIKLNSHKEYPQYICRKCLTEIENIILFKEDVQRNQDLLLNLFCKSYPKSIQQESNIFQNVDTNTNQTSVNADYVGGNSSTNSEYLKVPSIFLKRISPYIRLKRLEDYSSLQQIFKPQNKSSLEIKSIRVQQCKLCSKIFRYAIQLQIHYKKKHKFKKSITRFNETRIQDQRDVEIIDDKDSSNRSEPVNLIPEAETKFEDQALFLQNFNLVTSEEAQTLKFKRYLSNLVYQQTGKQQPSETKVMKSSKLTTTKKKTKTANKKLDANSKVLKRSIPFLTRYGFRNSGCNQKLRRKISSAISMRENLRKDIGNVKVSHLSINSEPTDKFIEAVSENKNCDNIKIEITEPEICKVEINHETVDFDYKFNTIHGVADSMPPTCLNLANITQNTTDMMYPSIVKTEVKPDFEICTVKTSPKSPKRRGRPSIQEEKNYKLKRQLNDAIEFNTYSLRRFCCEKGQNVSFRLRSKKEHNWKCQCSNRSNTPKKNKPKEPHNQKPVKIENQTRKNLSPLQTTKLHTQNTNWNIELSNGTKKTIISEAKGYVGRKSNWNNKRVKRILNNTPKIKCEKIVNLDVEDVEIQMLIYDCDDKCFDKKTTRYEKCNSVERVKDGEPQFSENFNAHSQNFSKNQRKSLGDNLKYTLRSRSEGTLNVPDK